MIGASRFADSSARPCASRFANGEVGSLCASRFADGEVGRVGRARHVGRWFPEICFRSFAEDLASPRGLCASRMNQNRRIQCNRQGAFAQDLATPSARSFALEFSQPSARSFEHRIPYEMIEASFMCEALRHLPLENQMSHSSHASHTSHPQAKSKARSTSQPHPTTPNNKKRNKQ